MNISSLNPFSNYSTWLTSLSQSTLLTGDTQAQGSTGNFKTLLSSADGDSFQMSPLATKMGGMQPMMGGIAGISSGGGGGISSLLSFLDKVKNGTVTEADLQDLQAQLNQADSTSGSSENTEASDTRIDIKAFLDKVKDGTVTEDDLNDMKEKLANSGGVPPMMGGGPPMGGMPPMMGAASTASDDSDDLLSFLEKVKDGTVTDSDLEEMQELLSTLLDDTSSVQESSETGEDTEASDIRIDIKAFLDKVKDGTVTEDDLNDMKEKLANSGGVPPMMGKKSSDSSDGSSTSQYGSDIAQQILSAIKAYENSSYSEYFWDTSQNYA